MKLEEFMSSPMKLAGTSDPETLTHLSVVPDLVLYRDTFAARQENETPNDRNDRGMPLAPRLSNTYS